jgi:hypothetical protein
MNGNRLGELNGEAIGIGAYDRAVGLEMLLPSESQDDLVTSGRRHLASDEYPVGADVLNKFTMDFMVDYIIYRNHALPSIVGTTIGLINMMRILHDAIPYLLVLPYLLGLDLKCGVHAQLSIAHGPPGRKGG